MSPHAFFNNPASQQRPICYRTRTPLWERVARVLFAWTVVGLVVCGLVLGVTAVIGRMQATQAQLDAAYLAGMATGQLTCGSH